MFKIFCFLLLMISLSFSQATIGLGCKYDPIIFHTVQLSQTIGYILQEGNVHYSISEEVQISLANLEKINFSIPVAFYYRLFFIVNQVTVYEIVGVKDFQCKFSTGIGFQYQGNGSQIYRPTIYYDYINKKTHISFFFIFEL